jgi:hypothetical protein
MWGGWDEAGPIAGQKRVVYISLWIKIAGNDYENQAFGTKLGFLASALPPSRGAGTQGYFLLAGTGDQRAEPSFRVAFHQETGFVRAGGFTRRLEQNRSQARLMTCGVWHHWEVYLSLNTLGQANGVLKWWIDGTPVLEYGNITYIFGQNTMGFWQWKWNPTWGGMKGVRTRDDFILIDDLYMSGLPYGDHPITASDSAGVGK